jgi:VWFA-related protein
MDDKLSRRFWLASTVALLSGVRLRGQPPDVRYSTDVSVVNVLATVRDKQGRIVRDLAKDDFTLAEDGRPQTIRYFSTQTDLPLTLGLLVDVSESQRRLLATERGASYRFLDQVLREDRDFAFVLHFTKEVELLQDLTASRKLLQSAIDAIGNPPPSAPNRTGASRGQQRGGGSQRGGRPPQGGGRGAGGGSGTALHDAVLLASDELMKKQKGRKALILLSDGVDTGSKVRLDDAIGSAQRADTLVYALRFYDKEAYVREFPGLGGLGGGRGGRGGGRGGGYPSGPSGEDGKAALKRLAKETGASYFEPTKKLPIEAIYSQIEEELRNQYNLGYTPDSVAGSGEYRRIQLTVRQKGMVVQTREGYYARP